MQEARDVIEALVAEGEVVYGVTTGFGDLATTFIEPAEAGRLQENLLMSHAAGVGAPFPREVVRAMLLLRANTLALGHSGCRPLVVDGCSTFLGARHPPGRAGAGQPRRLGRPRAAGPPRAAAHRPRRGRGRRAGRAGGRRRCARRVWSRSSLEAKEGLALLNGTQMMGALGALLLADADRLVRTASVAAAMSVEALLGTDVAFSAAYQLARPHPGQVAVAAELRHLLRDSGLQRATTPRPTRSRIRTRCAACRRSTARCATRSTSSGASSTSSSTRRPTTRSSSPTAASPTPRHVATGGGRVISGGNFHGEPIALALDFAKLAIAELGSISERRTALLVDAAAERRAAAVPRGVVRASTPG